MPVQRVTKYPLLLSRLHKVTPSHHEDKNNIKLAQDKIEAALDQMNKVRTTREAMTVKDKGQAFCGGLCEEEAFSNLN